MLDSAIAGFGAHQWWLSANSHNIANVNTDGFKPINTLIGEDAMSNPKATFKLSTKGEGGMSQTDLTKEMGDMIVAKRGFEVNAPVARTEDEILGSLLDIKG